MKGGNVTNVYNPQKLKYAGWMDHGFFWVQYTLVDQYTERDGYDYQHVIGAVIGESSGAVPSRGSATWEGVMVGADLARAQKGFYKKYLEWLQGDALLTADFQNMNMDVEFNDIRNLTDRAIHGTDSIAFNDIPFTSDGFASLSRPGNRISGTFYGSDQEEVGGIFEHGTIVGSFGGIRQ